MANNIVKSTIDLPEGKVPMEQCMDCGAHSLRGENLVHYK